MTLARLLPRPGDAVPTAEPGDPLQDEGHVLLLGAWSLAAATSTLSAGCCPWPATSRRRCFSSRRRTASRSTIWSCARHHLPDHATWAGSVCTLLPLPVHSRRLPLSDPDELDTATPLRTVTVPLASGTKAIHCSTRRCRPHCSTATASSQRQTRPLPPLGVLERLSPCTRSRDKLVMQRRFSVRNRIIRYPK